MLLLLSIDDSRSLKFPRQQKIQV